MELIGKRSRDRLERLFRMECPASVYCAPVRPVRSALFISFLFMRWIGFSVWPVIRLWITPSTTRLAFAATGHQKRRRWLPPTSGPCGRSAAVTSCRPYLEVGRRGPQALRFGSGTIRRVAPGCEGRRRFRRWRHLNPEIFQPEVQLGGASAPLGFRVAFEGIPPLSPGQRRQTVPIWRDNFPCGKGWVRLLREGPLTREQIAEEIGAM